MFFLSHRTYKKTKLDWERANLIKNKNRWTHHTWGGKFCHEVRHDAFCLFTKNTWLSYLLWFKFPLGTEFKRVFSTFFGNFLKRFFDFFFVIFLLLYANQLTSSFFILKLQKSPPFNKERKNKRKKREGRRRKLRKTRVDLVDKPAVISIVFASLVSFDDIFFCWENRRLAQYGGRVILTSQLVEFGAGQRGQRRSFSLAELGGARSHPLPLVVLEHKRWEVTWLWERGRFTWFEKIQRNHVQSKL